MKKVLIFENQVYMIENTFRTINLLEFDDKLEFDYKKTSQELGSISEIKSYDLIIIDIDLSINSKKDGIGIIKDIDLYNSEILKKVFVLTGSTKVRDKLDELGYSEISVLKKPTDLDEITLEMKKILK